MGDVSNEQLEKDELLIEMLLQEPIIFSQYFNSEGTIPNLDKATKEEAKKIFNKVKIASESNEEFEDFVHRIQSAKRKSMNRETQVEFQNNSIGTQVGQSMINNTAHFQNISTLEDDNLCNNNYFDPSVRRTLPLNFKPSVRKRKEEFNVVNFLMDKKMNQDYYPLTFQSEEEMQDLISTIDSCPDKKRLDLLAEGVLRKIAEHLETLNRVCNYRIMNVYYEKEIY